MPRQKPSARARGIGAELRRIREDHAELSQTEAARRAGWPKSLLSRLENGQRSIASEEVATLLAVYEYPLELREQLLARARNADEPGWWEVGLAGLPRPPRALAAYENDASRLVNWEPLLVPGLLQEMEYSRGIMKADRMPTREIEIQLTARLRRQQVLQREDLEYVALIGEAALHQEIAPPAVMERQMRRLIAEAQRPNIDVRVVPAATRPHPGLTGAFLLLEFPTGDPVVHLEAWRTAVFISERAVVRDYPMAVDQMLGVALGATESVGLIARVAEAWKVRYDAELEKREVEDE